MASSWPIDISCHIRVGFNKIDYKSSNRKHTENREKVFKHQQQDKSYVPFERHRFCSWLCYVNRHTSHATSDVLSVVDVRGVFSYSTYVSHVTLEFTPTVLQVVLHNSPRNECRGMSVLTIVRKVVSRKTSPKK